MGAAPMGRKRAGRDVQRGRYDVVRPPGRQAVFSPGQELTPSERAVIVEQAIIVLESFYVNLPIKRGKYAVDPLRRLKLFQQQLSTAFNSDRLFHREMTQIFNSLSDQHASYRLPAPFSEWSAWLPFAVEFCHDGDQPTYLVTKVAKDWFDRTPFREGVEVVAWSGVPIERAVELAGEQNPLGAGNPGSRHALGLQSLTARPYVVLPPPDEEWVIVAYRTRRSRRVHEIRVPWMVSRGGIPSHAAGFQKIRQLLFAPKNKRPFEAKSVKTKHGTFGYLRIYNFEIDEADSAKFVRQVTSAIKKLPENGLIVDIRENPGGRIHGSEPLLQVISPDYPERKIEPERLYFINTPLTLQVCNILKKDPALGPRGGGLWIESIQRGLETGAPYSAGFPVTDPDICNVKNGPRYPGPVVVVVDALTRSAAELLAAGFQDHGGKILGTDETTAGAGGQVRLHSQLVSYFSKVKGSPFKSLPNGAEFSLPIRRCQRVGRNAGSEIEDFGVRRDYAHLMTRDDHLHDNRDLIDRAATLLASGELAVQRT